MYLNYLLLYTMLVVNPLFFQPGLESHGRTLRNSNNIASISTMTKRLKQKTCPLFH